MSDLKREQVKEVAQAKVAEIMEIIKEYSQPPSITKVSTFNINISEHLKMYEIQIFFKEMAFSHQQMERIIDRCGLNFFYMHGNFFMANHFLV